MTKIDRPLSILYLTVNSNLGGAERRLLEEVSYLNKKLFAPVVGLLHQGPLTIELEKIGIPFVIFHTSTQFLQLSKDGFSVLKLLPQLPQLTVTLVKLLFQIRHHCKNLKTQIVVTYTFKFHIFSALLKLFIPVIIWQFCDNIPKSSILKYLVIGLAQFIPKVIVANSHFIASQFRQTLFSSQKVLTRYELCNTPSSNEDISDQVSIQEMFKIKPDDFIVCSIGALVPWKGQEYLIRAVPKLIKHIPNLKVLIAGDRIYDTVGTDTKATLQKLVCELGIEPNVCFTGFVTDTSKLLLIANVVVHTSVEAEPFGRVILEAMVSSKAVIATAAGGPLELIEHEKNGLLVAQKDPKALADAILRLYKDPELLSRLSLEGYQTAKAWQKRADSTKFMGDIYINLAR